MRRSFHLITLAAALVLPFFAGEAATVSVRASATILAPAEVPAIAAPAQRLLKDNRAPSLFRQVNALKRPHVLFARAEKRGAWPVLIEFE